MIICIAYGGPISWNCLARKLRLKVLDMSLLQFRKSPKFVSFWQWFHSFGSGAPLMSLFLKTVALNKNVSYNCNVTRVNRWDWKPDITIFNNTIILSVCGILCCIHVAVFTLCSNWWWSWLSWCFSELHVFSLILNHS